MFRQMSVALVLAGSAILLAGCGRGNPPLDAANTAPVPADTQHITLHVRDMTERQGLT